MRALRILMLGFRAFPGVQGGVETHAEKLFPLLRESGCLVEAVVRTPYLPKDASGEWCGVRYIRIWSPKIRTLEAIIHSFLGVLVAAIRRPDILHIHCVGPALMTPLARILGLKVVVTHHGPDYDRQKWGPAAKLILRLGESWGMRFSNERIAISKGIQNLIWSAYGKMTHVIPNGVDLPSIPQTIGALQKFGLAPRRYVLIVSRLVPEKRHCDLLDAFSAAGLPDWKLIIVGAADHPDAYDQMLRRRVEAMPNVVLGGLQTGAALAELYAHAGIFVLPSSHEGLPIALLEALSYGLPVLASDIPANKEIKLSARHYFPMGNVELLAERLREFSTMEWTQEMRDQTRAMIAEHYDWRDIALRTVAAYRGVMKIDAASMLGYVNK